MLLALALFGAPAHAACNCQCADGVMQPICESATEAPPVCARVPCSPSPPQATPRAAPLLSSAAQHASYCMGVLTYSASSLGHKYARHDRYLRTELALMIASGGNAILAASQSRSITHRGASDAVARVDALSGAQYRQCVERCGGISKSRCIVDCVDGFDPVAAKVLACQVLPDGLPY